ncbi:MAG: WD40 repeat domain-containing protein, partial [bacterium]|nr:WD40 repeat domain-containing protein [bacterium]
ITPDNAAQVSQIAQLGNGFVFDVDWSRHSNLLAVTNKAGTWLYDAETLAPQGYLPGPAEMAAWSPWGSRLAVTDDNLIHVWDPYRGEKRLTLDGQDWTNSLAYSPGGTMLATAHGGYSSASKGEFGALRAWDIDAGTERHVFAGGPDAVEWRIHDVTWSPDGRRLAAIVNDGLVMVWDVTTGEQILTFELDSAYRYLLRWSPDGKIIAAGGANEVITLWDAATGELIREFYNFAGYERFNSVAEIQWSPDGSRLATSHTKGGVVIWDPATGTEDFVMWSHLGRTNSMTWSPDGRLLASGGLYEAVQIWDAVTGESIGELAAHTGPANDAVLSPDASRVAAMGLLNSVQVWDVNRRKVVQELVDHSGMINLMVWSPDGRTLAVQGREMPMTRLGYFQYGLVLFDVADGEGRLFEEAERDYFLGRGLTFSPDGRLLAGMIEDDAVVWNVATGERVGAFPARYDVFLRQLYWSPDGSQLALTSRSWESSYAGLWVWDVAGGEELHQVTHDHSISSVAWSGGEVRLATVYVSGDPLEGDTAVENVQLWDVAREALGPLLEGHRDEVRLLSWSPDGEVLASGSYDGTVRLWEGASGQSLRVLEHSDRIRSMHWSPDNRLLLTSAEDETVRLWDAAAGGQLHLWVLPEVGDLSWSPDGALIADDWAGMVRLWGLPSPSDCSLQAARPVNRRWGPTTRSAIVG